MDLTSLSVIVKLRFFCFIILFVFHLCCALFSFLSFCSLASPTSEIRWKRIWHVTLPGIRNTIAVMLILESGNILSVSFNQIYILINDAVLDTGETLDYFVYRMGLSSANNFSVATAVSLIKSIVGLGMILGTNLAARKLTDGEGGIW